MKPQTKEEFLAMLNEEQITDEQSKELVDELAKELQTAKKIEYKSPKQLELEQIQAAKEFVKNNPEALNQSASTFDYKKYLQTDAKAKELMSNFLTKKGYNVEQKEEDYGIDLIANKNNQQVKFELEISSIDFDLDNYKYDEVHFLARKKKMLDKQGDYHYIIISSNHQYALTAKASDIFKQDNYITKYAGKGRDGIDEFYKLPKQQVKFFKL